MRKPLTLGCIEIEHQFAWPIAALSFLLAAQAAVFTSGAGEALRFVVVNFGFEG